ncbi:MAG: transcription antitermination factor NusB, partial [Alphaproteobacteria bacterium]|nr:transcription antitermination factor NusB [Alphaproteobacteria bacterium]
EINEIISSNLKGYTINRLNKIDLAIITLAVIELKFINETPKEIVINEAVELAKKYSTEKSPRFVNGVLADIVK